MHDHERMNASREAVIRRGWRLGALSAAALLLHAAVLGGAQWVWPSATAVPPPGAAMQVRVVERSPSPGIVVAVPHEAEAPAVPVEPAAPAVVAAPSRPLAQVKRIASLASATAVVRATPVSTMSSPGAAVEALPEAAPARFAVVAAAAAASAPPSMAEDEEIPHYRTRLPPPGTLRYEVSRGLLRGTGELAWRPQSDRYELTLDFKLSGLTILSQTSTGGFDAAGLAPIRFTDQRLRRGMVAANFQRAADKITYSGSSREFALRAGAQDRLSWMIQLAAIVAAEPQRARPGGKVLMYVTGANGDASVWVFRCIGPEPIEARGGPVDAIKFVREPREANDTSVQVWLDPKQHDLPVRATQKSGPGDDGYELRLLEATLFR